MPCGIVEAEEMPVLREKLGDGNLPLTGAHFNRRDHRGGFLREREMCWVTQPVRNPRYQSGTQSWGPDRWRRCLVGHSTSHVNDPD